MDHNQRVGGCSVILIRTDGDEIVGFDGSECRQPVTGHQKKGFAGSGKLDTAT